MGKRSRFRKKGKNKNFHKQLITKPSSQFSLDVQAEQLLKDGKYREVIDLLKPLAKTEGVSDAQLSALAYAISYEKGSEALEIIEKIKQPSPRDLRVKAWCYMDENKWGEAISLLENLIESDNSAQTRYALVVSLLKNKKFSQMFDTYSISEDEKKKNAETVNKIKEILDTGIKEDKVYPVFYLWLEEIWWRDHGENALDPFACVEFIKTGLKRFPKSEELHIRLAERLWGLEKREDATNHLIEILAQNGYSGEIYIRTVNYLDALERYTEALKYYEIADGRELIIWESKNIYKALLLNKTHQYDRAISLVENLSQSENLDHKFGANIVKAYAFSSKDDLATALIYFNEAIKIFDLLNEENEFQSLPDNYFEFYTANERTKMWSNSYIDEVLFLVRKFLPTYLSKPDDLHPHFTHLFNYADMYDSSFEFIPLYKSLLDDKSFPLSNKSWIWSQIYNAYISNGKYVDASEAKLESKLFNLKKNRESYLKYYKSDFDFSTSVYDEEKEEYKELWEFIDNKKDATSIHKAILKLLKKADLEEREYVFLPLFKGFWNKLLSKHTLLSELCSIAQTLLITFPEDTDLLWDFAYYSHELKISNRAEETYRRLLEIQPENSSALHNLSIILEENCDFTEAVKLSDKAVSLRPDYELFTRVNKSIRQNAVNFENYKSAWETLDFYKKKILSIIYKSPTLPSNKYIAKELGSSVTDKSVGGHIRKLKEQGWLTERNSVNNFVPQLLMLSDNQFRLKDLDSNSVLNNSNSAKENNSELYKPRIISLDDRNPIKRIFNSNGEFYYYQEFISLFPNQFVIPNVSLQTIFKYDTMLQLLDSDTFNYYLKASVDICVISPIDFLPRFGFELDGKQHEEEKQQARDERKNRIFLNAGLPLIRVKYNFGLSRENIRKNIMDAVAQIPNFIGIGQINTLPDQMSDSNKSSDIDSDEDSNLVF